MGENPEINSVVEDTMNAKYLIRKEYDVRISIYGS